MLGAPAAALLVVVGQLGEYLIHFDHLLGRGGSGDVYRATKQGSEPEVALVAAKRFPKDGADEARKELNIASQVGRHSNLVEYLDCSFGETQSWLILEFAPGGSLHGLIAKLGAPLPERIIAKLTRDALLGLQRLHSERILHRDVKPANLLLSANGTLKLCDYGLGKALDDTGESSHRGLGGTTPYMAPEALLNGAYSEARDIWAFGCTVVEMSGGMLPTSSSTVPMPPHVGIGASELLKSFSEQCLALRPEDRLDATALLRHPFLAEGNVATRDEMVTVMRTAEDPLSPLSSAGGSTLPLAVASRSREGTLPELAREAPSVKDLLHSQAGQALVEAMRAMSPEPRFTLSSPHPGSLWITSLGGSWGTYGGLLLSAYFHPTQEHSASTTGKLGVKRSRASAGEWAVSLQERALFGNKANYNTAGTTGWTP